MQRIHLPVVPGYVEEESTYLTPYAQKSAYLPSVDEE